MPPQAMLPKWIINLRVTRRWLAAAAATAAASQPPEQQLGQQQVGHRSSGVNVDADSMRNFDVALVVNEHQLWTADSATAASACCRSLGHAATFP